jgi:hypothetical protein
MTVNLSLIKYFNKLPFAPISYVPVFRGGIANKDKVVGGWESPSPIEM